MKLFIIGDTHGEWGRFNSIINKIYLKNKNEDEINIIVCGDFGYWPTLLQFKIDRIKLPNNFKIYFCPGNHENWEELILLEKSTSDKIIQVSNQIFYCSFGAIKEFDNKKFLFCGGAESIDKNQRVLGFDWFPDEVINYRKMLQLPPDDIDIDVVISHTCPKFLSDQMQKLFYYELKFKDPSCMFLNDVYSIFKPREWFFGHFHKYSNFSYNDTKFTCLNHIFGCSRFLVEYNF